MAPPVAIDFSDDFSPANAPVQQPSVPGKTLLICPPAVAANPDVLQAALATHPRSSTDVQMLDRIALGLVNLPAEAYATVILLSDPAATSSSFTIDTPILQKVTASMAPGSRWIAENNDALKHINRLHVVLAGLVVNDANADGSLSFSKPDYGKSAAVPLRLGKRKDKPDESTSKAIPSSSNTTVPIIAALKIKPAAKEYKIGLVDLGDDLDADFGEDDDDDDLIDENTLLDDSDLAMPVQQPPECRPKPGKRRRACKDCTCGLKEKIEAEDRAKRTAADAALKAAAAAPAVKLGQDDLAEVDFTVEGKASSCGNCYLGDAFRCDGCPYIGLPAFKPGEQVRLPVGDDQL
ncbi:electron carrier [Orbilia brochopaga]|uniref:Electron carrier n=1 Tax=Orbilia brochopaga TaxID=3140254 RepID=A0AAV9UBQ1_9PEZI